MVTESQLTAFSRAVSLGLVFRARLVCLPQNTVFFSQVFPAETGVSLETLCPVKHPHSYALPSSIGNSALRTEEKDERAPEMIYNE